MNYPITCIAFAGTDRIASGTLHEVAAQAKALLDRNPAAQILIFDDLTSQPVEIDFRGSPEDVLRRLPAAEAEPKRPGRPKLGVVAREVTLLPRHWEWLASQPGGASVALRKLVDQARHANRGKDEIRQAREATYRFLHAVAGNEPGFEEALRALFAGQGARFEECSESWPRDIRDHARNLAAPSFAPTDEGSV
jgi:hypothetical protein